MDILHRSGKTPASLPSLHDDDCIADDVSHSSSSQTSSEKAPFIALPQAPFIALPAAIAMSVCGFITEFFCGCCIGATDADDNIHHRSQRHRQSNRGSNGHPPQQKGYYRYYSQSERGINGHDSHTQARRLHYSSHPPRSHEMSERRSSSSRNLRSSSRSSSAHRDRDEYEYSNNLSQRRDDASLMGASLSETYKGYLVDEEDGEYELDAQSAIRRSLKDTKRSRKRNKGSGFNRRSNAQYQSEPEGSQRTQLESYIDVKGRSQSQPRSSSRWDDYDVDNVTTISKASKNPYSVLGISHSASPREIYVSYKQKQKEAVGSDKAFMDVDNAYRRLKAELKRKEVRRERRRMKTQQNGENQTSSRSNNMQNTSSRKQSKRKQESSSSDDESNSDERRQSIDARLKDHRSLVNKLFENDNKDKQRISSSSSVTAAGQITTISKSIERQSRALMSMSLVPIEAGAVNINEQNEKIGNSCFYLSLAASYLSGAGAFANDPTAVYYKHSLGQVNGGKKKESSTMSIMSSQTVEMAIATLPKEEKKLTMSLALQLKRAIEAAVVLVHPDWASSGMVGEEVQAFSDFLVYALDSDSVLGHWAIAVFDEASGFVDVYRGRHYGKIYPPTNIKSRRPGSGRSVGGKADSQTKAYRYKNCDDATKRAHTLTLRYIPGHYQPLLLELTKLASERKIGRGRGFGRPMLEDILATLEVNKVLHVVTDGRG